jgi:hypothetical protein
MQPIRVPHTINTYPPPFGERIIKPVCLNFSPAYKYWKYDENRI